MKLLAQLNVKMTHELREAVQIAAARDGKDASGLARELLERHCFGVMGRTVAQGRGAGKYPGYSN